MRLSRFLHHRVRAFTLMELLVVIGLIAVLASILLPVINIAHAQSDAMKCAANLRQLGSGINSYVGDHDGLLPGPLEPLVYPAYSAEADRETALVNFIGSYIGIMARTPGAIHKGETVTTCPGFVREVRGVILPSYVMNFADQLPALNQSPWGEAGAGTKPVQLANLTAWEDTVTTGTHIASENGQRNLTRTWAIKDADKDSFKGMTGGAVGGLPDKPVHKDFRNALFYDWHVGKIDLDDNPK